MRTFALIVSLVSTPAAAEQGKWYENKEFIQLHTACTRVYSCTVGEDIIHSSDKKVVILTDNKLVWGICSAADGPADSCNVCLTNTPSDACEWELRDK